jgi:hypothetical protein
VLFDFFASDGIRDLVYSNLIDVRRLVLNHEFLVATGGRLLIFSSCQVPFDGHHRTARNRDLIGNKGTYLETTYKLTRKPLKGNTQKFNE